MSDNPVKWTAAGLTPAGNALQAALLGTGDGLIFTRAAAADAEGVERLDLTLQSPCTVDGPKCRVPVLLTNAGVETAFTMIELRFYVRRVTDGAPTGEEILYATVTDETGDPIPTAAQSPGFTIDWAFVFQYGNAGSVTVTLDPVGLVSIGMVGQPGGVAALGDNGAVPVEQGGTGATTPQAALTALGAMRADATGEDIPVSKADDTPIGAALAYKVAIGTPEKYALALSGAYTETSAASRNVYYKSENNLIVVNFSVKSVGDGAIPHGVQTIAVLPEGFRPIHGRAPGIASITQDLSGISSKYAIYVYADTNGNINLHVPTDLDSVKAVFGALMFYID